DSGSYATTSALSTGLATKQDSGSYAALAGSTSQNFSASTLTTNTRLTLSSSASIRQTSTSSWTGDPGSGVGKIEYHSNRWYIVAGSNSTELLQVRRDGTNKFTIDNNGSISLGTVPAARISGTVSSATTAGSAATLSTARHIGGVSFNGSAAIDLPGVNTAGNQNTTGTSGGITFTELDVTAPNVTSGTWTQASASSWGPPKFNNTYNTYAYADFNTPAGTAVYRQWNIPTGMKSAYMSQLTWGSGGYVDVHGVRSDGGLVFLRRINTRQGVENTSHGGDHDGSTITFIGSGLNSFSSIRITLKLGRLHLTGLAFTPTLDGTEGTGMVHPQQLSTTLSASQIPTLNQNTTGSAGTCSGNSATATTATNQSGGTVSATTITSSGIITCNGNKLVITGGSPTLYLRDSNERTGMIHQNGNRMYFLSGVANSDSWSQAVNGMWPLYLQTDTNVAVFGGNVGIRNSSPVCPLHVSGYQYIYLVAGRYFNKNTTYVSALGTNNYNTTLKVDGTVVSTDKFFQSSDRRIKKDIVDLNDSEALDTLRLIKPKKYKYKDDIYKGTEPVYGFIAQEVRDVLAYATHLINDKIPNIYELAEVSESNILTFTNFNTSELASNVSIIQIRSITNEEHDVNIVEVIDDHTIRVAENLDEWTGSVDETGNVVSGNQIFVFGQKVDDFVTLDKSSIFTIATAALQEVDRQLQAEKARNDLLEARVLALENK
ncbi:MAG: tail fiber domain-containing protein, partial [Flavobacteriales bacterium]